MKRILLDQGLSPKTAELLRAVSRDAVHVKDLGLDRAADIQILDAARRENRTCVTLDHDFHAHLAMAQMSGPSVVLIRIEGLNAMGQTALIQRVWEICATEIVSGAAVSVDATSLRVRRLPLR